MKVFYLHIYLNIILACDLYTKCYLKLLIIIFQVAKQKSLNVKEKKLSQIAFSHVGCEKILVDTELIQGLLDKEGYQFDSNINDANVIIVNSYSFIETGREESTRKLLECTNKGK